MWRVTINYRGATEPAIVGTDDQFGPDVEHRVITYELDAPRGFLFLHMADGRLRYQSLAEVHSFFFDEIDEGDEGSEPV